MPDRSAHRAWRAALVAAFVLLLGGGAVWAASAQRPAPAPTAARPTPTPAPEPVPARVVPVPDLIPHGDVANLVPAQESTSDGGDARSLATVDVPGVEDLGARLEEFVAERVVAYEAILDPEGDRNELNVGWDPVLAVGDVLAVRAHAFTRIGTERGLALATTFYADVTRGTVVDSVDLFDPEGRDRATLWLAGALGDADLGGRVDPGDRLFTDVRLQPDGAPVVVLTPGQVAPRAHGPVAVRIEPEAAQELFSEAGLALHDQVVAGEEFVGIEEPPPPEPEPEPDVPDGDAPDCAVLRCVALTFDDGPGPYTEELLDLLARERVPATFFLVGRSAAAYPDLVRRQVEEGHVVGNHTWNHPDLPKISQHKIAEQLDSTARAVAEASGVTPVLVRPPYGSMSSAVAGVMASRGEPVILWDVDSLDWKLRDAEKVTERVLDGTTAGSIVLLHDIHESTVEAVPAIIEGLRAEGYTFVTVPQLLGDDLEGGRSYSSR